MVIVPHVATCPSFSRVSCKRTNVPPFTFCTLSMRVLCTALVLYLVAMTAVLVAKPDRLYDRKTRQYRPFGTAEGATLMPLWLVALLAAVGAYVIASIALSYPSVAMLLPFVGRGGAASAAATGTSGTVTGSTSPVVSAPTRTAPLEDTSVTPVSSKRRDSSSYTSALPAAPPLYEFRQPEAAAPFESMYDRLRREDQLAAEGPYADDYGMYEDDPAMVDPYYDEAAPPWPSPEDGMYYPPTPATMPMRAYGGGGRGGRGNTRGRGPRARASMRGGGAAPRRVSAGQGVVQRSRVWRRAR